MTDPLLTREAWLNGWPRSGSTVLLGAMEHCAGCGVEFGLATIALTGDEQWPEQLPDWPFEQASCPLCELRHQLWEGAEAIAREAARLRDPRRLAE